MRPGAAPASGRLTAVVRSAVEAATGGSGPVVVAVSGGVDSMVLLASIVDAGLPAVAVHVHHGLRGAEADADAAFVASECALRGIPLHIVRLEPGWSDGLGRRSLQDAARERRYEALAAVALEAGAPCIATGHTRDDQAETVLLHLARGTGPDGLAGMPRSRVLDGGVTLIRPLLDISRAEIEAFARAQDVAWREDATNRLHDYRRNAMRHLVMPAMVGVAGPSVAARIAHAADLMRGFLEAERDPLERTLLGLLTRQEGPDAVALVLAPWSGLGPTWRGRVALAVLRRVFPEAPRDRRAAARVESLATSQVGRKWIVPGGAVWRERDTLVFARDRVVPGPTPVRAGDCVDWCSGRIRLRAGTPGAEGSGQGCQAGFRTLALDADLVPGAWMLRPWSAGDRIAPAGHPGRARVKVLLTDARVPAHARACEPVLEVEGRVVALVGHAVDRSVRVTAATRHVLEIVREPYSPAAG